MKHVRYLLLLLALMTGTAALAQFNPNNPDEPGAKPWHLTLKAVPVEAGYFNFNQQTIHTEGEQMRLVANTYNNYHFLQWEDEKGNFLSTEPNFNYIMPAEDVTLVARYEYNPSDPNEPGQASIKRRLTLKTYPEGAGRFNLNSNNDISTGEAINLWAYSNKNYYFRNWTQEGTIVSTSSNFAYTMPDHNVTLVANFDYDYLPDSPNEPGQATNTYYNIYGVRIEVKAGQTINYPLYLENRGTAVTGFQVDINLPRGFTTDVKTITLTDRATNHTLKAEQTSEELWHITVSGAQAIESESGPILTLPIHIPDTATVRQVFTIGLANGLVVKEGGEQQTVNVRNGSLKIARSGEEQPNSPDYVITDLQSTTAEVLPGGNIALAWQVKNQGNLAGLGGWTERIYLVALDGRKVYIGSSNYETNELQPEASVSRNATITLAQLPGIDGRADVAVTIVPNGNSGEVSDLLANNTAQTEGQPITIGKCLVLTVPNKEQTEGEVTNIRCQLARSGNWAQAESFKLTKLRGDDRILIPETVVIPREMASAYFYLTLTNDDKSNADSIVSLRVDGNGYDAVEGSFTVTDDELIPLSLTVSKSEVSEGETFQLTVALAQPVGKPLTVSLTTELPKRFRLPASVVIPAGQTKGTIDVTAIDNEIPDGDMSCSFNAYAVGYEPIETVIILKDNDLPVLQLTLIPNKVAEGAGPVSVAGALQRTGVTTNKITVRLSDDSNGGLYFGTRELVLNKGVEEISFNFGPIDNALVDGDRTYTITAAVWLSSCSCSAAGESAGSVSAQLQVLDDDGPALALSSTTSTIKEGGKATLTVSRNTTTNFEQPLTIYLSSDYDENLSYEHTVTIPVGQQTAQVEITSNKNDVSDDSHTVVFTVQADGFASGTCWLMVTDQTLPDAVITNISVEEREVEVGDEVHVTLVVTNRGFNILPSQTPINVYIEEGRTQIGRMYTQSAVLPGDTVIVTKGFRLSSIIGEHKLYAVINESQELEELLYTNNTSNVTLVRILPTFTATIEIEKSLYLSGETIDIKGVVSGKNTYGVQIEVFLLNNGLRQTAIATTDEKGRFSIYWKPLEKQVGHFAVGACAPGEGSTDGQASFNVVGLTVAEKYSMVEVDVGSSFLDSLTVFNPCSIALTDICIETLDCGNFSIVSQTIGRLEAGQTATLYYSISGKEPTAGVDWQNVPIRLCCQEGGQANHQLYCYVYSPKARLETTITTIKTTMVKGKTREYPITIKNTGKGETGLITVDTGGTDWLSCVTSTNMQSLSFGDSITVVLRFTPTTDMLANSTFEGYIAINCENGAGCILALDVETVSEETGELVVDVCDEYTYFTDDAPHVAGAIVRVMHPVSGQLLVEDISNATGICTFTLPEGLYNVTVSKEGHESFSGNVMIDPGRNQLLTVTILLETIQVSIGFKETEVEDMYHITTIVEYETNVPTPVVLLSLPDSISVSSLRCGESVLINAVVTNKGLVEAIDTHLEFPTISGLKFTILDNEQFDLPAQQSKLVPVLVTRSCQTSSEQGVGGGQDTGGGMGVDIDFSGADFSDIPCYIPVYLYYGVNCLEKKKKTTVVYVGLKPCYPTMITDPVKTKLPSPSGGSSGSGGGGGDSFIRSGNRPIVMSPCGYENINPYRYLPKFIECLVKGIWKNLPVFGLGFSIGFCIDDLEQCVKGHLECPKALYDCLPIKAPSSDGERPSLKQIASPITSFLECQKILQQFLDDMQTIPPGIPLTTRRMVEKNIIPDYIYEYQERINNVATALQGLLDYMTEIFGSDAFLYSDVEDIQQLLTYMLTQNNDEMITYADIQCYKPDNVSEECLKSFAQRISNTIRRDKGEKIDSENYIHTDIVKAAKDKMAVARTYAIAHGYASTAEMMDQTIIDVKSRQEKEGESVCAKVTLQIDQEMVLNRPAIRATLKVRNGHDTAPMTDVLLNIVVKDGSGTVATEHKFQASVESLDGFHGFLDMDSLWTLDAKQTGTATILMIPTKYAAPDGPKDYHFGGTLSYTDPFTGMTVVREFLPQTLIVYPMPDIELTYLMQRDIYGDDPLTLAVEPMEKAEFALIINNKGNGEAKNVRMLTEQPKVVENEKGLFINFDIVSSQVNGDSAQLVLSPTIANEFGTIPAHSQAYAQWWLRSSLLGHFTSYEVEATHITNYGNNYLSLIDTVTIHEMIHGFTDVTALSSKSRRGYLVNDIVDANDMPDAVYFTDATQQPLYIATGNIDRLGNSEYMLTITTKQQGWNYGSVPDPTGGRLKLTGITRSRDGAELPIDNIWQTNRTLRDGSEWIYENRLHFVANLISEGDTFVLTFEPMPDVELCVDHFINLPEERYYLNKPLNELTVVFNKVIQNDSFTTEDLTLYCQGSKQDASAIVIKPVDGTSYKLEFGTTTQQDGYYVLTVQTAEIIDCEGFKGRDGKQATWVQYTGQDLGLNEIHSNDNLRLSPLPMGDWLYVEGCFNEANFIEIYDMRGLRRICSKLVLPGQGVYTGSLPTGLYYITVDTDKGVFRTKVLKR